MTATIVTLPEGTTIDALVALDNGKHIAIVTGFTATHIKLQGSAGVIELPLSDVLTTKVAIGATLEFSAAGVLDKKSLPTKTKPAGAGKAGCLHGMDVHK